MYTLIGILLGAAVWLWWSRRTVVQRRPLIVGKELDLEGIPRDIMLFGRKWKKVP